MMKDDEATSGVDTNDEKDGSFVTNRRQFMQATGAIGAAGLLGTTAATAQQSGDTLIELAAVQQGSGGPTDPDNDGLYEDVDGDGEMTHNDIVELFQRFDEPEIQSRTEDFDFNQNDRLDYDDIVTLQNEIESDSSGPGSDSGSTQAANGYAWLGISPEEIDGQTNPTLSLTAGVEYTVEWTNRTDEVHNFVIVNESGEEVVSTKLTGQKGETQSVTFSATDAMVAYYSESYPQAMRGSINVRTPEPSEDMISVMWLGGPVGGSHDPPERALQIVEYLLNRGIEVVYTDRLKDLLPETLHDYDAFMMYGNRFGLTPAMEDSILSFVQNGGGFVPLHSASGCFTDSEVWIDLVGGQFARHNTGVMTVDRAKDHPVFTGNEAFKSWDETYRHKNLNPDNVVLAYGDFPAGDYGPNEPPEPWTWVRQEGDGRVFYTAWGHDRRTWSEDNFKKLIENAIRWTSGNEDTIAAGSTRVLDELQFHPPASEIPYFGPAPEVPPEVGTGDNWKLMQESLPPEESLKRTITPENFDLDLYVTVDMFPEGVEGNIFDIEFDAQGRAWVALTKDYPNDLGLGNEDKIVICEDTDGDGVADDFTVFKDGLSIPISMVPIENGVIVAHLDKNDGNGKMLRLEDTDGDGVADTEDVLFSGFGTYDTHATANQLDYGIDNWIWGQVGYSGFSGEIAGEQREFSSCVYRFKLDDSNQVSDFEVVRNIPGNQAGLDFNEQGLAFASAATAGQPSNYVSIPQSYYELVNGFEAPTLSGIADTNRILPMTDRIRQGDRHWGFTAATGHTMYTARQYPKDYWNRTGFVSAPTGHLLSTFYFEPNGADFDAHYPRNMAASMDSWFSPIFQSMGPDGLLWFVDMYQYVMLHNKPSNEGPPLGRGNAYISDVRDHVKSRIYRVTYGDTNSSGPLNLGGASAGEMVDALTNDNMFWRLTAQRLLLSRGATDVASELIDLIESQSIDDIGLDPGAIHALWTLEGLGALEEGANASALQAARGALTHPSAGVRLNAARVLPGTATTRDVILNNGLLNDDNARVRMWALLTLAETPSSEAAGQDIYQMINREKNNSDELIIDAATSAAAAHATGFINAYEANNDPEDDEPLPNLLANPSFETGAGGGVTGPGRPAEWTTQTWTGSGEFTWATTGRNSDHSVEISSDSGIDAAWQHVASVEPNTEYTYTAYVKTQDLQPGQSYGALINVQERGEQSVDAIQGNGTNDWTKLQTSVNSGTDSTLTFNVTMGGYGQATGTVKFDDASAVDPNGNNVLANGGFETESNETAAKKPAKWTTTSYSGTQQFGWPSTGHTGEHSVQISSIEGADASWDSPFIPVSDLQADTQYTISGWVKTENLQPVDGTGVISGDDRDPLGAGFNLDQLEYAPENTAIAPTGTNDWTEISATFNSSDIPDGVQEFTINAFFGGYGQSTGTVWYDNVKLVDPDGDNLLPNPSFETGANPDGGSGPIAEAPEAWIPETFSGDGTYSYVSSPARTGGRSVEISSDSGIDGGWTQTLSVEPNATYRYSAWVKTKNLDPGSSHGAVVNLHQTGGESAAAQLNQGGTIDWTKIQSSVSVGDQDEVQFNVSMGGWGQATGTVWFDDAELVKLGSGGPETVYRRVLTHVQQEDGGDDESGDSPLDPETTIKLGAKVAGWQGQNPAQIQGETNPTLTLTAGETYTLKWTNLDGISHNFTIRNANEEIVNGIETQLMGDEGEIQTVEFTATEEMAIYWCNPHRISMRGSIEIVTPGSQ